MDPWAEGFSKQHEIKAIHCFTQVYLKYQYFPTSDSFCLIMPHILPSTVGVCNLTRTACYSTPASATALLFSYGGSVDLRARGQHRQTKNKIMLKFHTL